MRKMFLTDINMHLTLFLNKRQNIASSVKDTVNKPVNFLLPIQGNVSL